MVLCHFPDSGVEWSGQPQAVHLEHLERLPLRHDPALAGLSRALARLRWQLGFERTAAYAVRGAIGSGLVLIALSLANWILETNAFPLWVATASLLAAVATALVRWPSHSQAALAADTRMGLDERLATAAELGAADLPGRFAVLQVRDALDRLSTAPRVWLALDGRSRNEALVAVGTLVLAVAVALLLPNLARPALPTDTSTALAQPGVADDLDQQTLPIAPTDSEDAAAPVQRTQPATAAASADLASRVQQEQAERTALDKLAQALSNVSAGQPAADAIQQGDFNAAHDQLQNLGEEADQLSDAAKQQLARGLQQAAQQTGQADRALADREQQAAQALTHSTYTDQRQSLRNLADQVQRSGARSVPSNQLERDMGQLQQQMTSATGQNGASPPASQNAAARTQSASGTPADAPNGGQTAGQQSSRPGQPGDGAGPQNGAGVGTGTDPDMFSDQAQRLDTAGQKVQVPTKLGNGPGVRPTDGTEDQSLPDPAAGGRNVAELAQAQQTGQVAPEQNLVPGEQRPVVRGYFR